MNCSIVLNIDLAHSPVQNSACILNGTSRTNLPPGARWLPKGDAALEGNEAGRAGPPWRVFLFARRERDVQLRCQPGDLALVIRDTPRCACNIGRVVVVRGPLEVNRRWRLPCWLVRPVTSTPYAVEQGRRFSRHRVFWKSRVEHPDAWLLPLRDLGQPEDLPDVASSIAPVDWDEALLTLLRKYQAHLMCAAQAAT
jgi:hypothetical protein